MNQDNFEKEETYTANSNQGIVNDNQNQSGSFLSVPNNTINHNSFSQPGMQSYERIETAANIFGLDIFDNSRPVEQPPTPTLEPGYQTGVPRIENGSQQGSIPVVPSNFHQNEQPSGVVQSNENLSFGNKPMMTSQESGKSSFNNTLETPVSAPTQQVSEVVSQPSVPSSGQTIVAPVTEEVMQQPLQNFSQMQPNVSFSENVVSENTIETSQVMPSEEWNDNNVQSSFPSHFDKLMEQPPISDVNHDDELLEVFIGPNFDKITHKRFNFSGFFFGPLYLCYRKLFLFGFIFYVISSIILTFSNYIFILGIIHLFIAIFVNQFYVSYAKKKINKIKKNDSDKPFEEVKQICATKGRTNLGLAILCMVLTIVIVSIIFSIIFYGKLINQSQLFVDRSASMNVIKSVETAVEQKKSIDAYFKIPTKCMVNESATACDWNETALGGTSGSLDMSTYKGDIPFDAVICFDQNGKATTTSTCQTHIDFGDGAYVMDKNGVLSDQPIS